MGFLNDKFHNINCPHNILYSYESEIFTSFGTKISPKIIKIFQILETVSDHMSISQTTIFLYARTIRAFYLFFESHVSDTLSRLCAHCQRNKLSSEKLS